jgi:hypothetical protein
MSDGNKGHFSESDRENRVRAKLAKSKELLDRLDKKYGKAKPLSEDEQAWRWRHLMRHRRFLEDV